MFSSVACITDVWRNANKKTVRASYHVVLLVKDHDICDGQLQRRGVTSDTESEVRGIGTIVVQIPFNTLVSFWNSNLHHLAEYTERGATAYNTSEIRSISAFSPFRYQHGDVGDGCKSFRETDRNVRKGKLRDPRMGASLAGPQRTLHARKLVKEYHGSITTELASGLQSLNQECLEFQDILLYP